MYKTHRKWAQSEEAHPETKNTRNQTTSINHRNCPRKCFFSENVFYLQNHHPLTLSPLDRDANEASHNCNWPLSACQRCFPCERKYISRWDNPNQSSLWFSSACVLIPLPFFLSSGENQRSKSGGKKWWFAALSTIDSVLKSSTVIQDH